MIKKIDIENFKCFKKITVQPLKRVNLITGKNNIGKTALLEAIWLHEGAHNASLIFTVETLRGIENFDQKSFLEDIFINFNTENVVSMKAEYYDKGKLGLKIFQKESKEAEIVNPQTPEIEGTVAMSPSIVFEATEGIKRVCRSSFYLSADNNGKIVPLANGPKKALRPSAVFASTGFGRKRINSIDAARFSAQVELKRKDKIIESLKLIDSRLNDLQLSKRGGQDLVCADIVDYKKMLPLCLMGEGMARYLSFVLAILSSEGGTVLIDEIDNGFHYGIVEKLWKNLASLARDYDVQIIATTHSYECVEAAHKSFSSDEQYDFVLHRLDKVGDKIEDVTYDKETLAASLEDNLELR